MELTYRDATSGWMIFSFLARLFGSGGSGSDTGAGVPGMDPVLEKQLWKPCTNDTDIIDTLIFKPEIGYNKHKVPGNGGVKVFVEIWVQEVTTVSEITQDFELGNSTLSVSVYI